MVEPAQTGRRIPTVGRCGMGVVTIYDRLAVVKQEKEVLKVAALQAVGRLCECIVRELIIPSPFAKGYGGHAGSRQLAKLSYFSGAVAIQNTGENHTPQE